MLRLYAIPDGRDSGTALRESRVDGNRERRPTWDQHVHGERPSPGRLPPGHPNRPLGGTEPELLGADGLTPSQWYLSDLQKRRRLHEELKAQRADDIPDPNRPTPRSASHRPPTCRQSRTF